MMWRSLKANFRASPAKSAALGILALVLVVMQVRHFAGRPAPAQAGAVNWAALRDDPLKETTAKARTPRPDLHRTLLRNPFAAADDGIWGEGEGDRKAKEDAPLTLQFTMCDQTNESSWAVISGVVVKPGARVDGYEVVDIGRRRAVLRRGADELVLKMP